MKFFRYSLLAVSFVLLSACTDSQDIQIPAGAEAQSSVVFRASLAPTKAQISDGFGNITWSPSDSISLFAAVSSDGGSKLTTTEGGSVAEFTGEAPALSLDKYYALYPYNPNNAIDKNGVYTAFIPASQAAVAEGFDPNAFLMVGRSTSEEIGFYDALGGVRFTVEGAGYTKVIFYGNDSETLAGRVNIKFGSDGLPVTTAAATNNFKSISLVGNFEPGKYYYISMLPQELLKGFTFEFYKDNSLVKKTKCESFVTVNRYYFSSVKLADNAESVGKILSADDIATNGSANCYIISKAGSYKFPAVKGNSSTSVGNVDHCKVIWETDNTATAVSAGTVIASSSVKFSKGYVYFKTPDRFTQGNALIAACDASDKILWSWHIWLCDFDPVKTRQLYTGASKYMLDRNIGALSASASSPLSYGLFYQWGRKDPFLGAADKSSSKMASTGSFNTVPSSASTDVAYSISHPTTFITCTSSATNWLSPTDNTLWTDTKTIYDPCPAGWRVPQGGTDGVWYSAKSAFSADPTNGGGTFTSNAGPAWYPCNGILFEETGELRYVGTYAHYWTTKVASQTTTVFEIQKTSSGSWGFAAYSNNWSRCNGHSVRCVQE